MVASLPLGHSSGILLENASGMPSRAPGTFPWMHPEDSFGIPADASGISPVVQSGIFSDVSNEDTLRVYFGIPPLFLNEIVNGITLGASYEVLSGIPLINF